MRRSLRVIVIFSLFGVLFACNSAPDIEVNFADFPVLSISGDMRTQAICDEYLKQYKYTEKISLVDAYHEYSKYRENLRKFDLFTVAHDSVETKGLVIHLAPMKIDLKLMLNKLSKHSSYTLNNHHVLRKFDEAGIFNEYYFFGDEYDDNLKSRVLQDALATRENFLLLLEETKTFEQKKSIMEKIDFIDARLANHQRSKYMTQQVYSVGHLGFPLESVSNGKKGHERIIEVKQMSIKDLTTLRSEIYHQMKQANFFLDNFAKTITRNDIPFYDEEIATLQESSEELENEIFIADCDFDAGIEGDSLKLGADITVGGKNPILGFGGECRVKIEWKAYKK